MISWHGMRFAVPINFLREEEGINPQIPTQGHFGDAGWDLYASRHQEVLANGIVDVHTDIAIAIPEGYYGTVVARSSTYGRHGLHVLGGIIDMGYRGELFVMVYNPSDEVRYVIQGQRIAQLIVMPIPLISWNQMGSLPPSARGEGSFGSTGA